MESHEQKQQFFAATILNTINVKRNSVTAETEIHSMQQNLGTT